MLRVGGGSEGNAYFAYVVRGVGGLEAKCKILILIPLKRAFKFVKYHFSL